MHHRLVPPAFGAGSVWLVGAGPGDPGLLTLYALHALESADVILHDALIDTEVLGLAGPGARLEPVGKRAGRPSPKQLRINQRLIHLAGQGLRVVRLKGGDPLVFGRGGEEALALAAAGVPFRIVPGVSAGAAAPAYAGIPVTHRGVAQAVAFVTGHGAGGHAPESVDWRGLARAAPVLVLFMALRRIDGIAAELIAGGRAEDEDVALITGASTPQQSCRMATLGTVSTVADSVPSDLPTLVVIGPTAGLHHVLSTWQQTTPFAIEPAEPVCAPLAPAAGT